MFQERDQIVFTLVKEAETDVTNGCRETITDLISLFFVPHKINSPENPLHGEILNMGYIYYHVARTVSALDLMKVMATIACERYQLDCLTILPVGGITENTCRKIGAGAGTGILNYYINQDVGIHHKLRGSSLFIYPGV